MNPNLEGTWKQVRGSIREQWGRLTDDDLDIINGKFEQLVGSIQNRYGMAKDEAERSVREWWDRVEAER